MLSDEDVNDIKKETAEYKESLAMTVLSFAYMAVSWIGKKLFGTGNAE